MAVIVETFHMEEVSVDQRSLEVEPDSIALIERLGLSGQQSLICPPTPQQVVSTSTRIPFRRMKADESIVYQTLCPQRFKVEDYSVQPIPYRVLKLISDCRDNGWFAALQIWDAEQAVVRDPVLVGFTKNGYAQESPFILARWGEHLDEFPALLKQAVEKIGSILADRTRNFRDTAELIGVHETTYQSCSGTF